jgi:hypothetical protein
MNFSSLGRKLKLINSHEILGYPDFTVPKVGMADRKTSGYGILMWNWFEDHSKLARFYQT